MRKRKTGHKSPFLEKVRREIRLKQLSYSTEKTYLAWIKRFIRWSGVKHPYELDQSSVRSFLTDLAAKHQVAAATQNQALNALVFLYRNVLRSDTLDLSETPRANRPRNLPVVLTRDELRSILAELRGEYWLIACILYGAGLRISECLRLRTKDIEIQRRKIVVRQSKGFKDRVVVLPEKLIPHMENQIERVLNIYKRDREKRLPGVSVPEALRRKYPHFCQSFGWYYVFPSNSYSICPRDNQPYRHHLYSDTVRRQLKTALNKAGIEKHATSHSFRHSYATHSLEDGVDIRTLQVLLGHKDVRTTMIYTHVIDKSVFAVESPLDRL